MRYDAIVIGGGHNALTCAEVTQGPGAVGLVAVERPSDVKMLLKSSFSHDHAVISPNGTWMAYQSNVSGRSEIYVERYPDLGGQQQVSSNGGLEAQIDAPPAH